MDTLDVTKKSSRQMKKHCYLWEKMQEGSTIVIYRGLRESRHLFCPSSREWRAFERISPSHKKAQ